MMDLPENEPKEVTTRDLAPKMRRVGIGSRFYSRSLSQCGAAGQALAEELRDDYRFREINRHGQGYSISGGREAYDLFMVLARALHLLEVQVQVVPLSVLVNEAVASTITPSLVTARALFVHPMFRPELKQPLTEFQRLAVEDFLIERLDNHCAVMTFAAVPLEGCRPWWSGQLIERLIDANKEIQA